MRREVEITDRGEGVMEPRSIKVIMKTVTLYNRVVMEDLHLYLVSRDGEQQDEL